MAAREVGPLANKLLERIAAQPVTQADETPLKVQAPGKTRQGYLWTFLTDDEAAPGAPSWWMGIPATTR
ncbi:MAG TPA: transposase [Archangium sp.]|nr:transposase [Archangium sp.]